MRRASTVLLFLCMGFLPAVAWAAIGDAASQAQLLANRVGYGRLATGGQGGTLCTVSNLNDSGAGSLRNCIEQTGPVWVVFSVSGTITVTTPLHNPPLKLGPGFGDKTIDGRGANITIKGTAAASPVMFISGMDNYIIHNVAITTDGSFLIRCLNCKNIWYDHLDITGTWNNQVSLGFGMGGGYYGEDPAHPTTNITISYLKAHDRCLGAYDSTCGSGMILIGQSETETTMTAHRTTLHHNWYQHGADVRFPFTRHGNSHSFNNYLDNVDQGIKATNGGQLRSENDIFKCLTTADPDHDCGKTGDFLRVHCTSTVGSDTLANACRVINPYLVPGGITETYEELNPGSIFNPATDYSYASFLDTADDALIAKITHATMGAGRVSNPYNYLAVAGDAMVGWWKLDETSGTTAAEASGSGVGAGTLVNMESPTDWVTGLIKGALQFDGPVAAGGTNEYVTIPDSDLLSPVTTGEFSICAWIRLPSVPTDFAAIVAKGTSGQYEYALDVNTSQQLLWVLWPASGAPNHATVTSSATVSIGAWTHVCGTYASGVSVNVYLNAVNSGTSTAFTGVMTNGTSPVDIGRRPDNITYLNARVDDVRIFNYALTQPEIAAIMAEGFDVVYHLDEVASPANDSGQPGAYDGTWQNTPTPVAGKLNGALSFDSTFNEYVSVATSPSLSGAASVACWVKFSSALAGTQTVVSNSDASGNNTQVGLNINSDGSWNYLYTTNPNTRGFPSAAGLITVGPWIHLAATDDGVGNVLLYQAGVLLTGITPFGTPTAKPATAPGPLTIGQRGASNVQYLNGAVDECHLVSRVMSAGEILALSQEGVAAVAPAAPANLRVVSP